MSKSPPIIQQYNTDLNNKYNELENDIKNTTILFKISTTWCRMCKNKSFLTNYDNLKKKYNSAIKFVELDAEKDIKLLAMLDILENGVPYIKLFKKGKLLGSYTGINIFEKLENDIKRN
jgi:thioredoxin-like negative regulator of GroEL